MSKSVKGKATNKRGLLGPSKTGIKAAVVAPQSGSDVGAVSKKASKAQVNGLAHHSTRNGPQSQGSAANGSAVSGANSSHRASEGAAGLDRVTGKKRGTLFSAAPRATTASSAAKPSHGHAHAAAQRRYAAVAPSAGISKSEVAPQGASGAAKQDRGAANKTQKRMRPGSNRAGCAEGSEPPPASNSARQGVAVGQQHLASSKAEAGSTRGKKRKHKPSALKQVWSFSQMHHFAVNAT